MFRANVVRVLDALSNLWCSKVDRHPRLPRASNAQLIENSEEGSIMADAHTNTTAAEKNKALYRRFIQEVFNEGRLDNLDAFLSPTYIYRDAPPGTPPGADGIRQIVSMFRTAFPDLKISIEHQVGDNEYVCSRTIMRGTQKGSLFGISPTGKAVTVPGLTMVRIVDGRLVESWVKNDVVGLLNQLGSDWSR